MEVLGDRNVFEKCNLSMTQPLNDSSRVHLEMHSMQSRLIFHKVIPVVKGISAYRMVIS